MERRTPGLNLGTEKGSGRKEKPRLRSWVCWRGALAGGAQGTESPRWPRVLALSGRFPWRKRSKVSRAALQGRRAQLRHADGLRGCPPAPRRPTPAGRTFRGSTSRPQTFSSPTAARGCSSKTLLSPRHWDLVSSLEPLVNLRSGTTVPKIFKSLHLERFVLHSALQGK